MTPVFKFKSTFIGCAAALACALMLSVAADAKGYGGGGGFRGNAAIDIDALSEIVARISELAHDHLATIAEMDFNPLIRSADRIIAVDALIVKRAGGGQAQCACVSHCAAARSACQVTLITTDAT